MKRNGKNRNKLYLYFLLFHISFVIRWTWIFREWANVNSLGFFFSFWGKLKYMTYKFYSEVILWGEMRWQSLWGVKGVEENWHVPGQAWEPFWLFHHFLNNYYRRMDFQIKIHLRQSGRTLPYQWNDPAKAERKSDINDVIGCEHRPHSRMVVLW